MDFIDMGNLQDELDYIHCVIYGLAGCGKTHLLRDWPKPLVVMDFDNKLGPLKGVEGIKVIQYHMGRPEDAKLLIPRIWADFQLLKKDPEVATIAIDTVTALDRMLERYCVLSAGKGKKGTDKATIQEYGDMKSWYRTFFPALRGAVGKNLIVLCHEQEREDDDGKLVCIRPHVTGKMGNELPSIFEHCFHMEYIPGTNERRILHYKKHGKYVCASSELRGDGRVEILPDENSYDKICALIKEQRDA